MSFSKRYFIFFIRNLSLDRVYFSATGKYFHKFCRFMLPNKSGYLTSEYSLKQIVKMKEDSIQDFKDDNFFVIDNLPSPILIDVDSPDKFRKKKKVCTVPEISKKKSVPLLQLDEEISVSISRHAKKLEIIDCKSDKELMVGKSEDIKGDNFFVLDTEPSPILIEIDHPDKFRKKKGLDTVPKYTRIQGTGKRPSPKIAREEKSLSTLVLHEEPSTSNIGSSLRSENTVDTNDDEIIYEGEVSLDYLPHSFGNSGFFREHLCKATGRTFSQKRKHSTGEKYKTREKSTETDTGNINKQKEKDRTDSPDLYINVKNDSVGSRQQTSDVEQEIFLISDSDDDLAKDSSELVNEDSNSSHNVELEDSETSDTENPTNELIISTDNLTEYDSDVQLEGDSDIELEANNENSYSDIIIATNSSDFVPLKDIKLNDIENCPPINEEVRLKRKDLEDLRKWELTLLGQAIYNSGRVINGTLFTLLSYNVLSQQLLLDNRSLYDKCNPEYLEWSYRWPLIQHEIRHLQPDILTLQEVEGSHYHTHYLPWFTFMGYKCIYKKRTGTKVDGCVIAFNAKKFKLIEENTVEYLQHRGGPALDRDNVGIIVKLTPVEFYSPFCIATTHILYNPKRLDVKLAQMVLFLTELDRICYEKEEKGLPQYCPLILTGDFNASPESNLLNLVRRGRLNYVGLNKNARRGYFSPLDVGLISPDLGISDYCQHTILDQGRSLEKLRGGSLFALEDKRKIEEGLIKLSHSDRQAQSSSNTSNSTSRKCGNPSSGAGTFLRHAFNFKSAYYHKLVRLNGTTEVTTFQDSWKTVDYIYYTRILPHSNPIEGTRTHSKPIEGDLKLIGRYGLLCAAEADKIGRLPADVCPSDHYPLAAQFLLKRKS